MASSFGYNSGISELSEQVSRLISAQKWSFAFVRSSSSSCQDYIYDNWLNGMTARWPSGRAYDCRSCGLVFEPRSGLYRIFVIHLVHSPIHLSPRLWFCAAHSRKNFSNKVCAHRCGNARMSGSQERLSTFGSHLTVTVLRFTTPTLCI
jgi:hypothetical protein